ncbi:MAG: amidohydrolase [Clostridia bacterium]
MRTDNLQIPTLIIHNATVHTVDRRDSIAQAVAVAGNHILATGESKELLSLAGPDTIIIDAGGRSVIPGINDSHNHMWEAGMLMEGIITFGYTSIVSLAEEIGRRVSTMPLGAWLQGGGWAESQFIEGRMPTRHDLDPYSPNNPVVLERIFSTCCANSVALKLAGIDRNTPDPSGGEIGRDASGEPNGLLFRSAKQLVRDVMPSAFGDDKFGAGERIRGAITRSMKDYLSYGITSVVEPGVTPSMIRAYQRLRDEGVLKVRVNLMPCWHGFAINEDSDYSERLIEELGLYSGFGDAWLRIGSLKMAIDGGLLSKTSLRTWNYLGDTEIKPFPLRLPLEKLDGWIKQAHDNGWGVGIHVMGDVAIQKAVDAIYAAYKANPADRRHQLVHCYYPQADSMKKMAEAGMVMAAQPAFIYNEADGYEKLLPLDKQREFLPLRSCIDAGVTVAMGTDMPSAHHNPFWGLYAAVVRKGMRGYSLGKDESITVAEALRAMTQGGAYMTFEEKMKGTLEPGMLADLVLLNQDIGSLTDEQLKDITVSLTMVDGEIVYRQGND